MNAEHYLTINRTGEGLYREKGSKFLAFAYPVTSEDEIRDKVDGLKKKFHDARHHCYAWRLGPDKELFRANDDGEPNNSAGKPILGQILSRDLTNVLVVVVRYFGGTLLGVGGLIQAYKTAAGEALDNAAVVKKFVYQIYSITFEYTGMNTVMKILKDLDIEPSEQDFSLSCSLTARVKKSLTVRFLAAFEPFPDIGINYLNDE